MTTLRQCPCGSGQPRLPLYDARHIFCGYYCAKCEREKRARFRQDIFTDPDYWHDEPIEGDGGL